MRRTKEGFVPFEDDKLKDAENSPFEAPSVLVVKANPKLYKGTASGEILRSGLFLHSLNVKTRTSAYNVPVFCHFYRYLQVLYMCSVWINTA